MPSSGAPVSFSGGANNSHLAENVAGIWKRAKREIKDKKVEKCILLNAWWPVIVETHKHKWYQVTFNIFVRTNLSTGGRYQYLLDLYVTSNYATNNRPMLPLKKLHNHINY